MRIRITAVLLAMLALGATGCLQLDNEAVIQKDGSGTMTMQISVSQDVAQALEELKGIGGDAAADVEDMPDFTSLSRGELEKELKDASCKLVEFSNEVGDDGRRTIRMKVAFDDLDGLADAMAALGNGGEVMRVYRQKDGNYLLVAEKAPEKESDGEEEAEEDTPPPSQSMEDMAKTMEIMGKLMAHASELSIRTAITFPGEILDSNATRVDGHTAYWEMNASTMMSEQDMSPRVVFSGKGVKIDAPVKD